jgi:hypothetical protein
MAVIYLATIEGIGEAKVGGAGLVKYAFPTAPSYAGTETNAGLAETPRGTSSAFDIMKTSVSSGRFTVILRPDVGTVNFQLVAPVAKTVTAAIVATAASGDTTVIPVMQGSSTHGYASGDVIYIERESVLVVSTSDTSGSETITVKRGYAASTAREHPAGADLFATPPAMTGRRVSVYEVATTATSASSETLILEGYISAEVASGIHWPTFQVVSEFHDAELNAEPVPVPVTIRRASDDSDVAMIVAPLIDGEDPAAPRFVSSGGYWWFPELSAVYQGIATEFGSTGIYEWEFDPAPIFSDEDYDPASLFTTEGLNGFQIAYSNANVIGGYPPFKDDDAATSDHPINIAMNLLTSRDGAAQANGDWDLGSTWPADCTLGIAIADIDTDSALELRDVAMPNIRANQLWLGGEESEKLSSVLRRLLGLWGIAVGRSIDGKIKFLRLADVYSTDTVTAITSRHLIRPDQWKQYAKGRAIDSVVIKTEPSPDGETGHPVTVNEMTGSRWYPNQYGCLIGGSEKWDDAPYTNVDFAEATTTAYILIAARVRRLASRVAYVEVETGPALFAAVDIGDPVSIHDRALRDPTTGERLTAGDSSIKGMITSLAPDFSRRTTKITIAFTSTGHVATIAPSATVTGWTGASNLAAVNPSDYTRTDDAGAFKVGDVCVILNADLTLKGSATQEVTNIAASKLTFDGDFGVTPVATNVITFADYDDSTTDQQTDHAYLADGGRRGTPPTLGAGSDAAYTYGDI